jgi:uncharacterized protein YecE (DUF72 family)
MNVRLGTAGYAYPEWVGGFYPAGTTPPGMLPYYARNFPVVEINSSFYRPPTRGQVARMARRTPPGFAFTLKVPKSASHDRRPDDLPAFRLAADHLAEAGKLLGLIVQVPESFRNTAANRDWLTHVGRELRPHRVAAEFRHRSWAAPNLAAWAEYAGLDVVSVGVPDVPTLFPRGLRVANRRIYARLHSQNADTWYAGGKLRYAYDYPEEQLREWAAGLKAAADAGTADECLLFFNNCAGAQETTLECPARDPGPGVRGPRLIPDAVVAAWKLWAILNGMGPNVRVIDPPPGRQPSLFE